MAVFSTLPPPPPPIPPGIYIAKIIEATERVSSAGNAMISMVLDLAPGRQRIPSILTFVEAARPVINAFCTSAGLLLPAELDVEVNLTAAACLGRYTYVRIECDSDNGEPKVTRFIPRATALILNPKLAEIAIQPQAPVALPVVRQH